MKILVLFVATAIITCDAFLWKRKKCSTSCPTVYDPVCGSDGETYSNSCELEKQKCWSGDSTLKEVPCGGYGGGERCPKKCTKDYNPVCGSDKVTYGNHCEFLRAQCQDPTLKLKRRGECDHIGYGGGDRCPKKCTKDYNPVCGSDKVTYGNHCEFLRAQCQDPTLKLKRRGECDHIGKKPTDRCSKVCTREYNPVCGSDKVTYSNQCEFWKAHCQDPTLKVKGRGECGHIDYDCDVPCYGPDDPKCGSDGHIYYNECFFMKQKICHNPELTLGKKC